MTKNIRHSTGRCWIKNNREANEYEAARFILKKFKEYKIKTDHPPIVAFRENTQYVHYYPSQYCLKINTGANGRIGANGRSPLLMIDLWGRLNKKGASFADITVMGYLGKNIPPEILNVFNIVKNARDKAVGYLKKELKKGKMPTGFEVDKIARDYIEEKGFGDNFLHGLGHPLGFTNPHGAGVRVGASGRSPLQ